MAYYHRRKLNEYNTKITDSLHQLRKYVKPGSHCINGEYFAFLQKNITIVNIPQQMALLDTTGNAVNEIKTILSLEEKRRKSESQLKVAEEKHAVKKGRVEKRKRAQQKEVHKNPYSDFRAEEPPSLPSSQPPDDDQLGMSHR